MAKAKPGAKPNGKSVLVIDDDPMALDIYKAILEPAGYAVTTALDGTKGMAAFKAGKFHCVLVDIYMPGMSGLDIVEAIDPEKSGVPVIVVSGSGHAAGENALQLAMSLGASMTFTKGFEHADLLAAVKKLAGG